MQRVRWRGPLPTPRGLMTARPPRPMAPLAPLASLASLDVAPPPAIARGVSITPPAASSLASATMKPFAQVPRGEPLLVGRLNVRRDGEAADLVVAAWCPTCRSCHIRPWPIVEARNGLAFRAEFPCGPAWLGLDADASETNWFRATTHAKARPRAVHA